MVSPPNTGTPSTMSGSTSRSACCPATCDLDNTWNRFARNQIGNLHMPCSVQFSKYGDIDVVRVVDVPALSPDAEQVRIAVRAAGINPIDWKTVQGLMREEFTLTLPAGLGTDVAGVVDQVGADVTEFRAGDAVMGASLTPSFAEFAIADPASMIKKPAAINWEVAGSVAGAGGTAYAVLNKLGVHATDTLLIHAAAGGVGTFAVQLAIARGARVIGTASERNHDLLRGYGAIPVTYGDGLADRVRAVAPDGVDAVLDASGRGELPVSVELAGGPERVLTIAQFTDVPD